MAKRQRDHKAEYQRRKAIAAQSGFPSVRSYKRTRKAVALPRKQSFSIASIRRAGVNWSADHSRVSNSRYRMDFTDQEAIDYFNAYVATKGDSNDKMRRLHKYLVGNDLVTEEEWVANYLLASGVKE
jgi:hypothetical protein